MRLVIVLAAAGLTAACGNSNADQLQEAANQSDPAAAAVLENAAENGMDPQNALAVAGEAQVAEPMNMQAPPGGNTQAPGPESSNAMEPPEPAPPQPATPGEKMPPPKVPPG